MSDSGENSGPQKPGLSMARIFGEMFMGAGGAAAMAAAVAAAFAVWGEYKHGLQGSEYAGLGAMAILFAALALACPVGTTLGVFFIGSIGRQTGSLGATFGASVLGGALATAIFFGATACGWLPSFTSLASSNIGCIVLGCIVLIAFFAGPALGATIGFNLTRRYKSATS